MWLCEDKFKGKTASLPVADRVSKMHLLKLPNKGYCNINWGETSFAYDRQFLSALLLATSYNRKQDMKRVTVFLLLYLLHIIFVFTAFGYSRATRIASRRKRDARWEHTFELYCIYITLPSLKPKMTFLWPPGNQSLPDQLT